jgi:hypothetical protein
MPRSIIDIDVNDEQFKTFVNLYEKYQAALGEQPAQWAAVDAEVSGVAAGAEALTDSILKQNAGLSAQAKLAKDAAGATQQSAAVTGATIAAAVTLALEGFEAKKNAALAEAERDKKLAKDRADEKKAADLADKKSEEAKKKADAARLERLKAEKAKRKEAVEEVARMATSVASTAVDLVKWATLGGFADVAAGALGFWGLDKLVGSVGAERRAAGGLGITTGEHQAMNVDLQRYFDTDSALERVADAQNDPEKRVVFSQFGVNPNGKDPAQLVAEMAEAATRIFKEGHENVAYAQARGLTDIFSLSDLRRMAGLPAGELHAGVEQARRDAAPGGRLFLDAEVSRKWQNFMVALDGSAAGLKNTFVDGLAKLEPQLEQVIKELFIMANVALRNIDWQALDDGLKKFTDYIGSDKFHKDFKTFVDDVSYAANKMVSALRFLKLIPDEDTPAAPAEQVARRISQDQQQINATKADLAKKQEQLANADNPLYFGAGLFPDRAKLKAQIEADKKYIASQQADMASVNTTTATISAPAGSGDWNNVALASYSDKGPSADQAYGVTGGHSPDNLMGGEDQRNLQAMKFFMAKGWTEAQAAGIVGFDVGESHNLPNPKGLNDKGTAFGVSQWHKDRQARFKALFGHDIQQSTLPEQWAFQDWELNHSEKAAGDKLRRDSDAYTAGADVAQYYGRGANPAADRVSHGGAAVRVLHRVDVTLNNQTGGSAAASVNALAGGP